MPKHTPQVLRFAADYQMPPEAVAQLVTLADWAANGTEKELNGDPHADSANRWDKNANAKAWKENGEKIDRQILAIVEPYGFTAVVYTGIRPTLKRGAAFVEIPNS